MFKSINQFIEKTQIKLFTKIPNLESFENFRKKSNLASFILGWIALIVVFESYLLFSFLFLNGKESLLFEPFLFLVVLSCLYLISYTRFFRLNIYLFILFLAIYMNLQLYFQRDMTSHLFLYIGLGMVIQLLASYFLSLKQSFYIPLIDNIISTIHLLLIPTYSNYGVLGLFQTLLFLDVGLFVMNYYYQTGLALVRASSKQLEQEKQISENALNAKNKFLSKMSHELRTPLNIISGSLETIKPIPNNMEQEKSSYIINDKFYQMIKKANVDLTELINNLIVYSEIDENLLVKYEFFSVDSLLKELYEFFRSEVNENVNFSYQVEAPENIYLRSDLYLIKRIISNILSNSINNTSQGYIKLYGKAELLNESKAHLNILVQDSGTGFEYKKNNNRFQDISVGLDIQNINKETKGVGLGLPIVNKLIDLLGGSIQFESKLDEETKIILSFDLDFKIVDKSNVQNAKTETNTLKLLIGEDDPGNQELLKYLLQENHYLYDLFSNGREVLDCYTSKNHSEYDLILMDIRMPVMDGITAVKEIRKYEEENHLCKIPIIAVTAHALKEELLRTLDAGCNAYITKPYEFKDLKILIERFSSNKLT